MLELYHFNDSAWAQKARLALAGWRERIKARPGCREAAPDCGAFARIPVPEKAQA